MLILLSQIAAHKTDSLGGIEDCVGLEEREGAVVLVSTLEGLLLVGCIVKEIIDRNCSTRSSGNGFGLIKRGFAIEIGQRKGSLGGCLSGDDGQTGDHGDARESFSSKAKTDKLRQIGDGC